MKAIKQPKKPSWLAMVIRVGRKQLFFNLLLTSKFGFSIQCFQFGKHWHILKCQETSKQILSWYLQVAHQVWILKFHVENHKNPWVSPIGLSPEDNVCFSSHLCQFFYQWSDNQMNIVKKVNNNNVNKDNSSKHYVQNKNVSTFWLEGYLRLLWKFMQASMKLNE